MRYIIALVAALLLLSGCGAVQEMASSKSSFEITLKDGRTVQCVQVSGNEGSVAVACDFAGVDTSYTG